MHEVIEIKEAAMTRNVVLKNVLTGTVDVCFDDSELISVNNNFAFMKIGKQYDCKIELFGNISSEEENKAVCCQVQKRDVMIGKKAFILVLVGHNEYYILTPDPDMIKGSDTIYFLCTRKNLISVDHVICEDLLK